jgi:hypothetical protein
MKWKLTFGKSNEQESCCNIVIEEVKEEKACCNADDNCC